jgi:hypothetical protein
MVFHYRATPRFSASLGVWKWQARDPIGIKAGMNLYRYVKDNPINKIDPLGLSPLYGNYCGPGNNPAPPIDGIDSACQKHDKCYDSCGASGIMGALFGSDCTAKCDKQLCKDLKKEFNGCTKHSSKQTLAGIAIGSIFCDAEASY